MVMTNPRAIGDEFKQESSSRIYDSLGVFQTYFIRKSANTLIISLTESILRNKGYSATQVERMKGVVYLTLLAIQGSLATSGTSFSVTELMKYHQYSEDSSYWVGFSTGVLVSLVLDLTPWGITKTVLSTLGGIAGKASTLWAYEQSRIALFGAEESEEEDSEAIPPPENLPVYQV